MSTLNRKEVRRRIHKRVRRKVSGTTIRPRLSIHFSNCNVYAQIIDDTKGVTLCSASTLDKDFSGKSLANVEVSKKVGALIAERAKKAKIEAVVFDRGGYIYHGKVKALADAVREAGLNF